MDVLTASPCSADPTSAIMTACSVWLSFSGNQEFLIVLIKGFLCVLCVFAVNVFFYAWTPACFSGV
jgi:hypothetical protein